MRSASSVLQFCISGRDYAKHRQHSVVSSGHERLDRWLPMGGWQKRSIIELIVPDYGIGEMSLPMHYFRTLPETEPIFCAGMPFVPCAPAWAQQACYSERFWFVQTKEDGETLWALEQALASGLFQTSVIWLNRPLQQHQWRRLQSHFQPPHQLIWLLRAGGFNRSSFTDYRIGLLPQAKRTLLLQPYRLPGHQHRQPFLWSLG